MLNLLVFSVQVIYTSCLFQFTAANQDSRAAVQNTPANRTTALIEGRVVGFPKGEPLHGATVRVRRESEVIGPPDPNEADYVAVTQSDGHFKIEDAAPGDYRIYADMPTWIRRYYGSGVNGPPQGNIVRVQAGAILRGIDLELLPPGTISGQVLGENGKPLPGVSVLALTAGYKSASKFWYALQSAETNGDGEYTITGLLPKKYLLRVTPFVSFGPTGIYATKAPSQPRLYCHHASKRRFRRDPESAWCDGQVASQK